MPLWLILVIALPLALAGYSWYRHVYERECLALLREEQALALREARQAAMARLAGATASPVHAGSARGPAGSA